MLVGLLAVGVMAGCQSSDPTVADFGGESTDGSSPASASSPSGSAGPGSTVGGSTTTTVDPLTTTTVAAPASTLDKLGLEQAEEQIRSLMQRDWEIWTTCSTDPSGCDPAVRLGEVRTTTGAYFADNVALLRQWAAKGVVVRQTEGLPDNNFLVTESVVVSPDGTSATAVTCAGDGRARYEPGPGGQLTVVPGSEGQGYNRSENYVVLDGGSWKIDGFKVLDESLPPEGAVLCRR